MAVGSVSNSVSTPAVQPSQTSSVNPNNGNLEKAVEADNLNKGGGHATGSDFFDDPATKQLPIGDDLFA